MEDTIVALATPAGNSGVAVIRISGGKSKAILQKLIKEKLNFEPRKMYLKKVFVKDFFDNCLVVFFKAPFSFTGEDVAEVQSHGGYFLAQSIIDEAIKFGARLATAGEFSKRAFLNGKISLDQAEGIADLINAETDMQAKESGNLLAGKLKESIVNYQNELTDILAEIEAKLDYPEYEYTESETSNVLEKLNKIKLALKNLIDDSFNGQIIKNGVKVAIVGEVNVGKSSLLNALTKSNKAIVTNIAGTTRDVIEAEYEYKGIIFRLFDTAGFRKGADEVEKIGIERAKKMIDECDIVLRLSELNKPSKIKVNKPCINVINKIDLHKNFKLPSDDYIAISAKTNKNITELKEQIFNLTIKGKIDSNKLYLTNARHIDCVKRALHAVNNAIKLFNSTTMDIISAEIKTAWLTLGEISGTTTNEAIIDKIFSKFCLGK